MKAVIQRSWFIDKLIRLNFQFFATTENRHFSTLFFPFLNNNHRRKEGQVEGGDKKRQRRGVVLKLFISSPPASAADCTILVSWNDAFLFLLAAGVSPCRRPGPVIPRVVQSAISRRLFPHAICAVLRRRRRGRSPSLCSIAVVRRRRSLWLHPIPVVRRCRSLRRMVARGRRRTRRRALLGCWRMPAA